jgi:hypothetical protein
VSAPIPRRQPTAAEAFFRTGFGCASAIVGKILIIVVVVLVLDWRSNERKARREAERAAASETAAALADEYAKETDSEGRFVRKREGPLPETDVWGGPYRLAYKTHTLSDELEIRSSGPDGEWDTRDDIVVSRTSKISNKAVARDAAGGLLDAAKARLWGKNQPDAAKK